MITVEQASEISRLASLWATSRVRKVAVHSGYGGGHETPLGVTERERKANAEFHEYVRSLIGDDPC